MINTNSRLERGRYQTPCRLLGAGEQGQGRHQEGEGRIAGDDDGVGGHAGGSSVPDYVSASYSQHKCNTRLKSKVFSVEI